MTEVSAQQNLFDLGKDLPLYEQHTDAQQNVWFELKTTTHSDLSGDVPSRCVLSPSGLSAMVDYKQGLGQAGERKKELANKTRADIFLLGTIQATDDEAPTQVVEKMFKQESGKTILATEIFEMLSDIQPLFDIHGFKLNRQLAATDSSLFSDFIDGSSLVDTLGLYFDIQPEGKDKVNEVISLLIDKLAQLHQDIDAYISNYLVSKGFQLVEANDSLQDYRYTHFEKGDKQIKYMTDIVPISNMIRSNRLSNWMLSSEDSTKLLLNLMTEPASQVAESLVEQMICIDPIDIYVT